MSASWREFFENIERDVAPGEATRVRAPVSAVDSQHSHATPDGKNMELLLQDSSKLYTLVRSYRVRGHLRATLDPLNLDTRGDVPDLDVSSYGFTQRDLDKKFYVPADLWSAPASSAPHEWRSLGDIVGRLQKAYCGNMGVEFMHMTDNHTRQWMIERFEMNNYLTYFTKDEKLRIYKNLAYAELFEAFLARKHPTAKRFGIEGAENIIPGIDMLIHRASTEGIENVVIGMAHRGRLNVLGNIMRKPYRAIFKEFNPQDSKDLDNVLGSGDVKYHLGTSNDRVLKNGKQVHLSLASNPSHLEFVNPVVEGKTRAKQHFAADHARHKSMSLLIHGDAAFAGQGVVPETLSFTDLIHYRTGGTCHIILNNQIGFTTEPKFSRSTAYASDVAKAVGAPIVHVNGDDPVAVCYACEMAAEFRQTFKRDFVVDVVCYRRNGHNEIDQPMFTQPLMYRRIAKHKTPRQIYADRLISEGLATREEIDAMDQEILNVMESEFQQVDHYEHPQSDWFEKKWMGIRGDRYKEYTAIDENVVDMVGNVLTTVPPNFEIHDGVARVLRGREKMFLSGKFFDWAVAEQLAFGSLLLEDFTVRLSGQDVERGTFSQRHAVWTDQANAKVHIPLYDLPNSSKSRVTNSHLSETAVLGFELGFSLESPEALVIWEAQFGDFCNGAQVIIDQFIAAGEQKWMRQSALVMLLPHGFDGQGPEHSSGRIERFLQLCDDDPRIFQEARTSNFNMFVCNFSTPANYFHALRRQIHNEFHMRKPLIVFSPKRLLRLRECCSDKEEFTDGAFQPLIGDRAENLVPGNDVQKVIFTSGQFYYDLAARRSELGRKDVAIVTVEQYHPFPWTEVAEQMQQYPNAELVWAQEEPMNMGAWTFVQPRFGTVAKHLGDQRPIEYVGRDPAAAPGTGFITMHQQQLSDMLQRAFH